MILTHQFSCSKTGCRAFVLATLHMHDEHECDLEKLGEALGFRRVGEHTLSLGWQCAVHEQKEQR